MSGRLHLRFRALPLFPFSFSTLAALCLALTACQPPPAHDPRTEAPRVRVASVQPAQEAARRFTGVVAARVQSDLGFRVGGKVTERLVDAGQAVKRGQPLMRLDAADLALQLRAQQAAVAAARAQAVQTAEDEARYRKLVATGAVAASTYDQLKAAADAAQAQLKAAEAQAEVARNASGYALLRADADGVVLNTLAEPGQVVAAGQAVVRLAHTGPREAVVHLPETLRPAPGAQAQAWLYGQPQERVSAQLRQRADVADPLTRTYEARYTLHGALAQAPLGATVTLELTPAPAATPVAAPSWQVPIGAVFQPGGPQSSAGVWVLQATEDADGQDAPDGETARATWRPVQVLGLTDEWAQVAGDLAPHERVVALGAHLLREGQTVRPLPAAASAVPAVSAAPANTTLPATPASPATRDGATP